MLAQHLIIWLHVAIQMKKLFLLFFRHKDELVSLQKAQVYYIDRSAYVAVIVMFSFCELVWVSVMIYDCIKLCINLYNSLVRM